MNRQRHPWDPVVLTTLPQILCAIFAPYPYSVIIAASSIASTVWHLEHEPMSPLFWLDYSCSFVWRFYDITHLGPYGYLLNMIGVATYILAARSTIPYERAHALWNLFACILTVVKVDMMWRAQQNYFEAIR